MREFIAYLTAEQPRINATLEQEVSRLNRLVQPVATHVLKAGGKRLRPLLALLTARALGYTQDDIYPLACSVELLHSATLLHDDIIDDADLRRGLPSAHTQFGTTRTVLAGDALLAQANSIVARYGDPRLTACIADAITATVTGEIAEIEYLRSTDHTQDTYIDIIKGKTAFLIQASCSLGGMRAGADSSQLEAVATFGLNLGIAFQIVDDALDFAPSTKDIGKPVAGDLREGKLTPPLLMYRDSLNAKDRKSFVTHFEAGTLTEQSVCAIATAIREQGLDARTRELADSYLGKAQEALAVLPDVVERELLAQTVAYVRNRKQ